LTAKNETTPIIRMSDPGIRFRSPPIQDQHYETINDTVPVL